MSNPSASNLTGRPGLRLGDRYVLTALLATGGMAEVWDARDEVLDRRVAVKILHRHLSRDTTFLARFTTEAKVAARIQHSGIVSIFDTVSEDSPAGRIEAIVMELLVGVDLRKFLDDHGPLTVAATVDLGVQVADALGAAHQTDLVHRDIKPGNIMMVDDRRIKVTDFGIAKPSAGADLTEQGSLVGTAKYLAPEQVTGNSLDHRADIYALGVVLFECLAGRPPFVENTSLATAMARLKGEPPRVRSWRSTVPPWLDDIIARSMAPQPDQRFADAAEFRAALLEHDPSAPLPTPAVPIIDRTIVGDAVDPVPSQPSTSAARSSATFIRNERRWLVPIMLLVIIAGALAVAGALIGSTDTGRDVFHRARDVVGIDSEPDVAVTSDNETPDSSEVVDDTNADNADFPLRIVNLISFDPEGSGNPGENDSLTPLLVDADQTTVWTTEGYSTRQFGNLKSGVGVIVQLNQVTALATLVVHSPTNGWAAQIYVTDAETVPVNLDQWGEPIATQAGITDQARIDLGGRNAQHILLWITDLGDGPPNPRFKTAISELSIIPS
jgi:eukaryotic-like serine/threonine-protein kinase